MIRKFTGFKGVCAMAQVGKIQFCILAKNAKQLETLWSALVKESGQLEPDMCKKAILIEANLLPAKTTKAKQPTAIIEA